jgi:superfamily II DNA or RNA helicase
MKRLYVSGDRDEHDLVLRRCGVPVVEDVAAILRDVIRRHLALPSSVERSHKTPHAHQTRIVRAMRDNRGMIVSHKVGSGKTLTAILVSQDFLDRFPWRRVIVITPAGLLNNFRHEMTRSFKNLLYEDRYEFFSYHAFVNRCKDDGAFCGRCAGALLIIDEAHNLRQIYHRAFDTTARKWKDYGVMNKWITRCAERADKVLLLTGTPVYNHPNDIAALYNMIRDPIREPKIEYDYEEMFDYGLLDQRVSVYEPPVEAGDYPRRVDHLVPIVMNDDFVRRYEELIEHLDPDPHVPRPEYLGRLYGEDTHLKPFFNGVRRGVNNLEDEHSAKIQWVVRKILNPATPGPILVFSAWLNAGNRVVANILENSLFNGKPVRYRMIEGSVPVKQRRGIVSKYNYGRTRVLFLSRAGGEGLDLRNTRTVIIMEESWNRASQEQVIGRAIRYRSHHGLPEDQRRVDVYILNHILPTDMDHQEKVRAWLNDGGGYALSGFPVPLYEVSIDFVLRAYHKKKKKVLDGHVRWLRELSYRGRAAAAEARERREH